MKLNPDCIKDVLEAIEEATTPTSFFTISSVTPQNPPLNEYTYETLLYHIRQCYLSDLITGLIEYDCGATCLVKDLSPLGHEFLANVRTNTVWNKIKEKGISSIPFLLSFAKDFALAYYQSTL